MGCDIHPRIQVKSEYSSDWKTVAIPNDGRWYTFFELLVGVRAMDEFGGVMEAERGLPEPLGYTASFGDQSPEDFGDHSFSWWTLAEMKSKLPEAEAFCSEDPEWRSSALDRFKSWIALGEMMGDQHEAEDDDHVRFVVGFDN